MTAPAFPSYAGHRFPAAVISHAVWLYFRFPLSLRMVEEMLAARGIIVSHETIRQWALKFGQDFASADAFALNGKRGAPAWWRGLAPASSYPMPTKRAIDATRCLRAPFHEAPPHAARRAGGAAHAGQCAAEDDPADHRGRRG